MKVKVTTAGALWLVTLSLLIARSAITDHHTSHVLSTWALAMVGLSLLVSVDVLLDRHRAKVAEIVYLATVTGSRKVPSPRREPEHATLRSRMNRVRFAPEGIVDEHRDEPDRPHAREEQEPRAGRARTERECREE